MTTLSFSKKVSFTPASHLVIGNKSLLDKSCLSAAGLGDKQVTAHEHVASGKVEEATQFIGSGESAVQVTFANLSDKLSRHLGTIRSDLIPDLVKKLPKEGDAAITLVLAKKEQTTAVAAAVARAFPIFDERSSVKKLANRKVNVNFSCSEEISDAEYSAAQNTADAVRFAASLVDQPTNYLNTDTYHEVIKELVSRYPSVKLKVFRDQDLKKEGLNSIWQVGKAATFPPLMAVLEYAPEKAVGDTHLALVGKGIVYDSGGLSLKVGGAMSTMKCDMAGSATILAGFEALVKSKYQGRLSAVLCIAENAIGPLAYKNDDIFIGYSGKSVEINNTDAEGRVVMCDGVAWATKNLACTHLMDFATLTGAQLVCTGTKHAAIMSNEEDFERLVKQSGHKCGDWVHPIVYAPELLMSQFESQVADMKNSVKDRMNAQSSCAGHFIEAHFDESWKGSWCHVDMAGPAFQKDRATGYGPTLVYQVAQDILHSGEAARGN